MPGSALGNARSTTQLKADWHCHYGRRAVCERVGVEKGLDPKTNLCHQRRLTKVVTHAETHIRCSLAEFAVAGTDA